MALQLGFVLPSKADKINLNPDSSYPCPCRRQGELLPIALTEALGCKRCQQIFVVKQDGYAIEKLSANYPYRQIWFWTGQQWQVARRGVSEHYWYLTLGVSLFLVILLLLIPLVAQQSISQGALLVITIAAVLAVMMFLAAWINLYRR